MHALLFYPRWIALGAAGACALVRDWLAFAGHDPQLSSGLLRSKIWVIRALLPE